LSFQVTYGALSVNLGNELTPTQVKDIPQVKWNAENGSLYTVCMTGNKTKNKRIVQSKINNVAMLLSKILTRPAVLIPSSVSGTTGLSAMSLRLKFLREIPYLNMLALDRQKELVLF
jgi:hypothetical protein